MGFRAWDFPALQAVNIGVPRKPEKGIMPGSLLGTALSLLELAVSPLLPDPSTGYFPSLHTLHTQSQDPYLTLRRGRGGAGPRAVWVRRALRGWVGWSDKKRGKQCCLLGKLQHQGLLRLLTNCPDTALLLMPLFIPRSGAQPRLTLLGRSLAFGAGHGAHREGRLRPGRD